MERAAPSNVHNIAVGSPICLCPASDQFDVAIEALSSFYAARIYNGFGNKGPWERRAAGFHLDAHEIGF